MIYKRKYTMEGGEYQSRRGAITLIEVLIALGIFSFVSVFVFNFFYDTVNYNRTLQDSLLVSYSAGKALQTMSAEIRAAGPSIVGAFPVAEATSTAITFYSDLNGDGMREQIRYSMSGTTLFKRVIVPSGNPLTYPMGSAATTTLVENIRATSTIFTFYGSSFNGVTATSSLALPINPQLIRMVRINLTIDRDVRKAPEPIIVQTQTVIRNLKDNL